MKPLRIYVAGPYQAKNCSLHDAPRIAQHNTDKAIEVGNALIEKGHFVFVPHLSHYMHTHYSCRYDYGYWWYKEDNTFLEFWADALFYISPSIGADAELELAKKLGLRIFRSLEEVPDARMMCSKCGNVLTKHDIEIYPPDFESKMDCQLQTKVFVVCSFCNYKEEVKY